MGVPSSLCLQAEPGAIARPWAVQLSFALEPLSCEFPPLALEHLQSIPLGRTRHLCEKLLRVEPALWASAVAGRVDPTDWNAEQALHRSVPRHRAASNLALAGAAMLPQLECDVLGYPIGTHLPCDRPHGIRRFGTSRPRLAHEHRDVTGV